MSNGDNDDFDEDTPRHQTAKGWDPAKPDPALLKTIPSGPPPKAPLNLDVISSTDAPVARSKHRVPEADARVLITDRMAEAGIHLSSDYSFVHRELLVTLDGYDPAQYVGFQYLSHEGEDVVTDFSTEVESQIAEITDKGIAHILVIHDYDTPNRMAIIKRVEAFLFQLPSATPPAV